MSTESPPEPTNLVPETARLKPVAVNSAKPASGTGGSPRENPDSRVRLADAGLTLLFLGLTFLLGVFPLKDADFYWHLRTGDLIQQSGDIPRVDTYSFISEGSPWIDLHWMFQIAISWMYQRGGVVGLNLAKCAITTVAIFLLVTARRRKWPIWVMILAWLPAILVLSGRMYVRPETLTLLYISIFLAVIVRWDRHPWLAWLLPVTQVAWVNSHGLFVLGPIVLMCALVDSGLSSGSFSIGRRRWWRTIGLASLATGLACLVNPYGIHGAIYPLQLASTMQDPIFSKQVAELMSIRDFIASSSSSAWRNLPLQLHALTMILGALSFLIPFGWWIVTVLGGEPTKKTDLDLMRQQPAKRRALEPVAEPKKSRKSAKTVEKTGKGSKISEDPDQSEAVTWRPSLLRLLLFVAFSALSLRATRNSHQFAAVVGTITAWNFGEWVYILNRRRNASSRVLPEAGRRVWMPRLVTAGALLAMLSWVGSGWFYEMTGERRVVGLHEEPLWFPHEAAKFAGGPDMPNQFVSFHNGNAGVFEYYHSPAKKVYTDPRLEVAGPKLFREFVTLENHISMDQPGWEAELDAIGRPTVMADHEFSANVGASILRNNHWRCVWFDPIVAVFVHEKSVLSSKVPAVDFLARHFRDSAVRDAEDLPTKLATAKAIRNYVSSTPPELADLRDPMALVGLDESRDIVRRDPGSIEGWKVLGQIEYFRQSEVTEARYRSPFNSVVDLSSVRATTALRRALELSPRDFLTLWMLRRTFTDQRMYEAALPMVERIAQTTPINKFQETEQRGAAAIADDFRRKLGPAPAPTWQNLGELDQIVSSMMASGRVRSAADLLERANPVERAPWDVIDRIATLRLHLGDAAQARALWELAATVPRPAVRDARVAATYLAGADFARARKSYETALGRDANLFEALYGLALLERDAGDAARSAKYAKLAVQSAPDAPSKSAAEAIVKAVSRFANVHEDLAKR